jgi:hypothetical protein
VKRKIGVAATAGALAASLILVLTACGGNDDPNGVASLTDTTDQSTTGGGQGSGDNGSGATSEQERQEAMLEYAQCMREHGIDMPDPVNGRLDLRSTPGDEEKMEEAQEACQDILQGTAPPLDEEEQAEMQEAMLAFARCMREHGVDMPDPQFQDEGFLQLMPEGTEDDPDFEEAQQACQPILDEAQPDESPGQGGSS